MSSGELATNYFLFFSYNIAVQILYATIHSRANQSSQEILNFLFYGLHLRVPISATADEPVYREYRSLYSQYTCRMFTVTVSHALTLLQLIQGEVLVHT
jgi:hypothetical protein